MDTFAYYSGLARVDSDGVVDTHATGLASTAIVSYCLTADGRYLCLLSFSLNMVNYRPQAVLTVIDLDTGTRSTVTVPSTQNSYSNASYLPDYHTLTGLASGLVLLTSGRHSASYGSVLIDPAALTYAASPVDASGLVRVAQSADGTLVAGIYSAQYNVSAGTWTPARGVRLFDATTLAPAALDSGVSGLPAQGSASYHPDAALSPDGHLVAVAGYRAVTVYRTDTGVQVFTDSYTVGSVPRVQFSPTGAYLVVRAGATARVYDVAGESVTTARTIEGFGTLGSERPYGRTFAFVSAAEIADAYGAGVIVDVTSGALVRAMSPAPSDFGSASPYSRHVATALFGPEPPAPQGEFWTRFHYTAEQLL